MSKEQSALNEIVDEATTLLRQTELALARLAQAALASCEELHSAAPAPLPTNNNQAVQHLQEVAAQLTGLSQQSGRLHAYLKNGFTPPAQQTDWSRIKILQSQEEERTQLARELEDNVGQLLANAVFELASCRHLLENNDESVADGLSALQQELEQGLADIRYVITDLEPGTILGNFGLGGGLRRYLEQFEVRTGLKTDLHINTNIGRLPHVVEVAIFRVIQESLQNVWQHAQAATVTVTVEDVGTGFEFCITDNGVGLASDRVDMSKKNFGLARMVDYADLVGGKLSVFSEPKTGTKVTLEVPYHLI